jgi:hypothetical protein
MDYNRIRELVKKYWEGQTTIEEEEELKEFFFTAAELPQDLGIEQELFRHLREQSVLPLLEEDLTIKLRSQWKSRKRIWLPRHFLKYAALLVPLLVIGYLQLKQTKTKPPLAMDTDSFRDPKKALAETEKTLLLLSKNLDDGMASIQALKLFEPVKKARKTSKDHSNH